MSSGLIFNPGRHYLLLKILLYLAEVTSGLAARRVCNTYQFLNQTARVVSSAFGPCNQSQDLSILESQLNGTGFLTVHQEGH